MIKNINPYNITQFKKEFKYTEIYNKLKNDFDIITWTIDERTNSTHGLTPREFCGKRIFSAVPFYYINFLCNNKMPIYDIGCGWNIYKKYYDIIGISGEKVNDENFNGDMHGFINNYYTSTHTNAYTNIMAMNSLHFIRIRDFSKRIKQLSINMHFWTDYIEAHNHKIIWADTFNHHNYPTYPINLIDGDKTEQRDFLSLLLNTTMLSRHVDKYHLSSWNDDMDGILCDLSDMGILNPHTFHPTKLGHKIIAEYLLSYIDKNVCR